MNINIDIGFIYVLIMLGMMYIFYKFLSEFVDKMLEVKDKDDY